MHRAFERAAETDRAIDYLVNENIGVETSALAYIEDRYTFHIDRLSAAQGVSEMGFSNFDHEILDITLLYESKARIEGERVSAKQAIRLRHYGRGPVYETAGNTK